MYLYVFLACKSCNKYKSRGFTPFFYLFFTLECILDDIERDYEMVNSLHKKTNKDIKSLVLYSLINLYLVRCHQSVNLQLGLKPQNRNRSTIHRKQLCSGRQRIHTALTKHSTEPRFGRVGAEYNSLTANKARRSFLYGVSTARLIEVQ